MTRIDNFIACRQIESFITQTLDSQVEIFFTSMILKIHYSGCISEEKNDLILCNISQAFISTDSMKSAVVCELKFIDWKQYRCIKIAIESKLHVLVNNLLFVRMFASNWYIIYLLVFFTLPVYYSKTIFTKIIYNRSLIISHV